jgi:hypothetical protein
MIPKVSLALSALPILAESAKTSSRKPKHKRKRLAPPAESALHMCFREAEICCEEARSAARLKRFGAAFGLFATAQSLLLCVAQAGGELRDEACERLASVSCEMAAYHELARSAARPMRGVRR